MPSEKRRKRRRLAAEQEYESERERAQRFGLELTKHDIAQYSLAWPTGGARWELYPTTQRIYVNREKKTKTPALPINGTWTLATVVDAAVKVLGLKHAAPPVPTTAPLPHPFVAAAELLAESAEQHIDERIEEQSGGMARPGDRTYDEIAELPGGPTAAELERLYRDAREGCARRLADDEAERSDIADDLSLLAHNLETTMQVHQATMKQHVETVREIEKRVRNARAG
jgi:hypothetical protein